MSNAENLTSWPEVPIDGHGAFSILLGDRLHPHCICCCRSRQNDIESLCTYICVCRACDATNTVGHSAGTAPCDVDARGAHVYREACRS
mmetsp:Transcript_90409/g.289868  ORF Transcript_90409/g.289868 Transcript_90409/m.289868 type:complete len:89 (+) Transcript_90409:307-573(+)